MRNIEVVFFDLDHTLWDYNTNAAITLKEVFYRFELKEGYDSENEFISAFHTYNYQLWDLYNYGKIDRTYIREQRFKKLLEDVSLDGKRGNEISDFFIEQCPRQEHLLPGSIELLDYLRQKYRLAVITNGFTDTQTIKIESSGISPFFEEVITSENANARKPSKDIFDFALKRMRIPAKNAVMIGDNISTDIEGANVSGLPSIWLTNSEDMAPSNCKKVNTLSQVTTLL
ncbi:MAG: YjjG family noncanonical pyrimidine nucleotidase [Bacteroidota bacterium]